MKLEQKYITELLSKIQLKTVDKNQNVDCCYLLLLKCCRNVKMVFFFKFNNLPSNDNSPQAIQMTRLTPTEPVLMSKPLGETNIPDPASFPIAF